MRLLFTIDFDENFLYLYTIDLVFSLNWSFLPTSVIVLLVLVAVDVVAVGDDEAAVFFRYS